MACTLSTVALIAALGVNTVLGSVDAETCPLAGCGRADGNAALASALMQQVQAPYQEQVTKILVNEEAAAPFVNEARPGDRPTDGDVVLATKSTKQNGTAMLANLRKRRKTVPKFQSKVQTSPNVREAAVESSVPEPLSMLQMSSKHNGMARLAYKAAPRSHVRLRGWTAPLDEAGYQAVAALKSDDDMDIFIRRVIDAYDCKVVNQLGFMGIVPWFSGTTAVQSFEKLQETLLYAVLARDGNPWLVYKNTDGTTGNNAELSFMGYVEVAATRKHAEMLSFARRVCDKLGVRIIDESRFDEMVRYYSGAENFQDYNKLEKDISAAAGVPHSWAAWKGEKSE